MLTIFTPTYNRAELLVQLYTSLKQQTCKRFVWLIIDDGSKDNTEELIEGFKKEKNIEIIYIKQKNGGKHRAFNLAIKKASTEIFICVDSDDYLVKDAIEKIIKRYEEIRNDSELAGIAGLCIDKNNNIMGGYPTSGIISDTIEIRDKYKLPGEPEIYKTKILKKYKFEEFSNEKFLTEAILFDKLTQRTKIKYYNDVLIVKEYLKGGLTDNQLKIRVDCINGTLAYYEQRAILSKKLNGKYRANANIIRFSLHCKDTKFNFFNRSLNLIFLLGIPVGIGLYLKDLFELRRKYGKSSISN